MSSKTGRRYVGRAAFAAVIAIGLAGCETSSPGIGGDLGAMVGEVVGDDLDPRMGRHVQRVATKTGQSVEEGIFAYLSTMDEAQMATATARTAETGRSQTWSGGSSGASGSTRPTRAASTSTASGDDCREIEQSVTLANGRQGTKRVRACKNAAGRWEIEEI
jgi:hypothetical protein